MKTLTKVGLSALAGALAVTSANAGEMSLSGSIVASYSKGSGYHTTGNPLAMDKELSVTGSGELDNGTTVSYKQTITDAMAFNDSEVVFGNVMGTTASLAMTSAGDPMSAIDDVTPTAFEEANAITGSIKDVNGIDGTYSLRVTQADLLGTGFTVDAAYAWEHGSGDAGTEKGSSGVDADEITVVRGVTETGFVGSDGNVEMSAMFGSSLPVAVSVPPIDTIFLVTPSAATPGGALK